MDTVGAFAGPLVAMALMGVSDDSFRLVFLDCGDPGLLCVLLIVFGVEEPERPANARLVHLPLRRATLALLPRRFWWVSPSPRSLTLAASPKPFCCCAPPISASPSLGHHSIPSCMNVVYAASAYPSGHLAENGSSRRQLLAGGIVFLIRRRSDPSLAPALSGGSVAALRYGTPHGATQGLLAALGRGCRSAEVRWHRLRRLHTLWSAWHSLLPASSPAGFGPLSVRH